MSTALFVGTIARPVARLFSIPETISNKLHRRKHLSQLPCPLCNTDLHRSIDLMIRQGFYQPAIAATRLRIELIVVDYYRKAVAKLPQGVIPADLRGVPMILLRMHAAGEITLKLRRRIDHFYSRSSRVVHGHVECTRLLARDFANEAEAIAVAIQKGGAV
ncbi:MAG: hypothetical protein C0485_12095 [Pirellula sp.]|nr:hypothetical protein [Pirellula sp.]